ncbi:MAG TPA: long-chain fatty acid--CoA ligase [bacterium]|nr:long-chain fatty acid--CoA ligase [bacterium]
MTDLSIAQGSTYAHVILDATLRFARRPAMKWMGESGWRTTTYSELRGEILAIAAALQKKGVSKGDRVGIWMETCRNWVLSDLVIQILGGVTVPIYHTQTPEKALRILKDAEVRALFSTSQRLEALRKLGAGVELEIDSESGIDSLREAGQRQLEDQPSLRAKLEAPDVLPEDLSAIIYTSGTTGEPKGAMLTHASIVANARGGVHAYLNDEAPVVFLHLPLAHVVGRNAIETMTLTSGGVLAIAEPERERLVSNLRDLAPTELVTVPYVLSKFHTQVLQKIEARPAVVRRLFHHALSVGRRCRVEPLSNGGPVRQETSVLLSLYDRLFFRKIAGFLGGHVRQIITGAAHLSRETLEFFWSIGIPTYEAYGMTETTSMVTYCSKKGVKFTTVGRPAEGMEIKLAPDGEILVRGVGLMKGYWKRPEGTRDSFDLEGWYRTGDLGSLDSQGYLTILDRKKEIFVLTTGKNVAPQAIENTLKLSPLVENACVFGDNRNYMTALIYPEWSAVRKKLGADANPALDNPALLKLFNSEVQRLMQSLPDYERVKRFALVEEPFSVDNDLLTPTLKLRRKQIEEYHRDKIESLYSGPQSNFWFLEEQK